MNYKNNLKRTLSHQSTLSRNKGCDGTLIINMRSSAHLVKGQGVGSCYEELVSLLKSKADNEFSITENQYSHSDIIHYHTINFGYFIERMLTKHKKIGVGYVHFLPETIEASLKMPKLIQSIFNKYILTFYNSMDSLVTVNPYFIDKIKESGVNHPETVYIPNFVSTKLFYPMSSEKKCSARKEFLIEEGKFTVLGVGQLQTRKGILDYIKTAQERPDINFIWAGGFSFGKMNQGYEEIKEAVKSPPKNVRFLGMVDRKLMPLLYNAADLLFMPSYDELFPMAILEAISCKTPVLVRDVPLYEKILFDYCPKAADVKGFSSVIGELNTNKNLYHFWENKSWECHKLYTEEKALKMWTDFYKEIFANFYSDKT